MKDPKIPIETITNRLLTPSKRRIHKTARELPDREYAAAAKKKLTPLSGTGRPQTVKEDTGELITQPPIPKSQKAVKFQIESKAERGKKLLEIDKQDRRAQNKTRGRTHKNPTTRRVNS
jgi:hypothetical protein